MRKGQRFSPARYRDRLLSRSIFNSNGCLEVQASIKNGYGKIIVQGKELYAHRFVWEGTHGPIPTGVLVLHGCDNRKCINVDHLHLGSNSDNLTEFVHRGRHHSQKLERSDIIEIRHRSSTGESFESLGRSFHISGTHAARVAKKKCWRLI
jgi:hypothetical protein